MKLINHVLKIRSLVQQSIDNRFSRIGLKENGIQPADTLPDSLTDKRQKLEDILKNHLDELGEYAKARQETINECTFTLFNRIAAIKVMEDKELFPEVIRRRPENGNRSFAHNLWLEEHPEEKNAERQGLKHFLQDKFNELGEKFPLYAENYPYAMMPMADELFNILEAFNEVESDPDCGLDIWKGDDILGWLYENFNATEKEVLKASGEKTEYDKVSLQSQVYTPQWVVKFLVDNTLGKMYLEMFPDSNIVKPDEEGMIKYRIANAPKTRTREPKKMEEIRVIDPACGSGNFLIYTFTLLYDMYINQIEQYGAEYSKRDIPKLIIENNIYGVDLDERAVQLSQIALYIKAREVGGRRAQVPAHTNVVSTHFFLPNYDDVASAFEGGGEWDSKQKEVIRKIWTDLQNAYKFGTLVRVEEVLNQLTRDDDSDTLFAEQEADNLFSFKRRITDILREQVKEYCVQNASEYALTKANDAMTFLGILSMPFDVVVANPPYTDSGDFGPELKSFVDSNYKIQFYEGLKRTTLKFNSNLYACFIKRCCELAGSHGKVGMIHPMTFMYIKTFEDIRAYLLTNTHINLFVEYGLDRVNVFGDTGLASAPAFYTLDMDKSNDGSVFFQMNSGLLEREKKAYCINALNCVIKNEQNSRVYRIEQSKLKGIKSFPFIYWISDDFRDKFTNHPLSTECDVVNGCITGKNEGALRFWWEVSDYSKWEPYAKGGPWNKWFGNTWLRVITENDFEYIKSQKTNSIPSVIYKAGITYNGIGTKGLCCRVLDDKTLYDMGSSSLFPSDIELTLGILNSKLIVYSVNCLNPTVNVQSGDIRRLPFLNKQSADSRKLDIIRSSTKSIINIKRYTNAFNLIEADFKYSPITPNSDSLLEISKFYNKENALITEILLFESVINRNVFDVYNLSENDIQMVLDKEGIPVGDYPVSKEAKAAYKEWLVSNNEFPASDEVWAHLDALEERTDLPSINNLETLYTNNRQWEEFCTQHNLNPVELWYQFKKANIVPPQRTQILAFELLTDVIRATLAKDDDGVIPLADKLGEDCLFVRIEQEFIERGYTSAQFNQISQILGGDLGEYLQERFFQQLSDHLNLFMYLPKTPFIWHLTSGEKHALDLYISIYKWNRNTLFRIKSIYASNREAALKDRLATLSTENALAQMEANTIKYQLAELKDFVSKIDDLLASGYDPKLDDGVGKNIAPLQKRGMLSYNVLNPGQLKKYLNADW